MKKIGKLDLFSIALGSVIGWGAFILPGSFFLPNAGVLNTFLGFSIAIVMIAAIEKNYSVLMTRYNSLGGEYTYAKEVFGNRVGFTTGWLLLLAYISIIPLNATAIPMVFEKIFPFYTKGKLLYSVLGFPVYLNDILISLSCILVFSYVQIKGLVFSARLQNFTVLALIISVIGLLISVIISVGDVEYNNFQSNMLDIDIYSVVRIIAFAPWAFIGFDTVAQVSSQSKVSPRMASLMALIAVVFGGFVYNALNVVTAFGVSNSSLLSDSWATGEAVSILLGKSALLVIGVAMFGAVLSGLNGFFMSSTRLTYAIVSNDSVQVVSNNKIKKVILFITLVSSIVPFFGRNALFWFVDVSSVGASFAYLITSLAAFKLCNTLIGKFFAVLGTVFSSLFLLFLLTPFFGSNIPIVSAYVLLLWLVLGSSLFIKFRRYYTQTEV